MEPKFKVGDKVRILGTAKTHPLFKGIEISTLIGNIDTIERVVVNDAQYSTDKHVYRLTTAPYWWDASMLELIVNTEKKEPIKILEPAVGEVFEHEGKIYICIEKSLESNETCEICSFRQLPCSFIRCNATRRNDHKDVYFKEIYDPLETKESDIISDFMSALKLIASTPSFVDIEVNTTESKKDSNKSIIEYIMELNKKPNYKLKFKL